MFHKFIKLIHSKKLFVEELDQHTREGVPDSKALVDDAGVETTD